MIDRVAYQALTALVRLLVALIYRPQIEGLENIPEQGGVLICANHIHLWDPPYLSAVAPRKIHWMAKAELFEIPGFPALARIGGAFPVRRGSGDRGALRRAVELLEEGKVVGMFPEGTRQRDGRLGKPRRGVGLVVRESGAQVVPVAIKGPWHPFQPVKIRFGRPFRPQKQEETGDHEGLTQISREIMEEIGQLMKTGSVSEPASVFPWR